MMQLYPASASILDVHSFYMVIYIMMKQDNMQVLVPMFVNPLFIFWSISPFWICKLRLILGYSLMSLWRNCRPTSEFPHPLSRVKNPAGYRVSEFHSLFGYPIVLWLFYIKDWPDIASISLYSLDFNPGFILQLSYQIVDSLIWLGIRDMINDFRKKKLKLRPVTYLSGAQGSASDIPTGYIWSPHLVPKPKGLSLSLWNLVY